MGKLTVGGKQQQARCVVVEATNHDPPTALQWRKRIEDRPSTLGIFARTHLAHWLVIEQHSDLLGVLKTDRLVIQQHCLTREHSITEFGELAIDAETASLNPSLHFTTRAKASGCQCLLQFFALGGLDDLSFGFGLGLVLGLGLGHEMCPLATLQQRVGNGIDRLRTLTRIHHRHREAIYLPN